MTGSLEEEAARLLGAAQEWVARSFPAPENPQDDGAGHGAHLAGGAAECAWCPVCRVIAVLRGDHPEVTERLAEAGTAVVAALRSLFEPPPPPPARPGGVQKIDLSGGTG